MTEDDSESVATDSQAEEEGELPVIQLCGLVEELRYRHHEPLWPVLYRLQPTGAYAQPRGDLAHYGGEGISFA